MTCSSANQAPRSMSRHRSEQKGFQWVDYGDRENSVMVFQRQADENEDLMIVICNFTPAVRYLYRIGVPYRGQYKEVFNSDDRKYGGSGMLNQGLLNTSPVKFHSRDYSVSLNLPPLAIMKWSILLPVKADVFCRRLQKQSLYSRVVIVRKRSDVKTVSAAFSRCLPRNTC